MGLPINNKKIKEVKKLICQRADYSKKKSLKEQVLNIDQRHYHNCLFSANKIDNTVIHKTAFSECQFNNYEFYGVTFDECTFVSCDFISCSFLNCRFFKCTFIMGISLKDYKEISEQQYSFIKYACCFGNTNFAASSFSHCNMKWTVFNQGTFLDVAFDNSNMIFNLFSECSLTCRFINSRLDGAVFLETKVLSIRLEEYDKYGFDRNTIFHCASPEFDCSRNGLEKINKHVLYKGRFSTYSQISKICLMLGLTDMYGEYYYLAKKCEQKTLSGIAGVSSLFSDALCGYGERPSHTFFFILGNILLFGLLYLFTGFAIDDTVINASVVGSVYSNVKELFCLFCHSVFFSVTTFSTVGYGNYVPVGVISSTLAAIQMLMGVSLTAMWTGCIFRKISR